MNIILFSGGIDSTIGLWLLRKDDLDWQPVYFDLNSHYTWKELARINVVNAVARKAGYLQVRVVKGLIDVSVHIEHRSGDYTAQRNTLLCASSQAVYDDAIERIALCSVADDVYRDNDGSFHQVMSNLLTVTTGHQVQVFTPLREGNINGDYGCRMLTKNEAVRMFLKLGGNPDDLRAAISCYHAVEVHCGRCRACVRYEEVMELLDNHNSASA